jgi:hypothetical protein
MKELERLRVVVRRKYDWYIEQRRAQPDFLVGLDCLLTEALSPDPPEPEENFDDGPPVSLGPPKWNGTLWREGESKRVYAGGKRVMERLFSEGWAVWDGDSTGWRQLGELFGEDWRQEHAKQKAWEVNR